MVQGWQTDGRVWTGPAVPKLKFIQNFGPVQRPVFQNDQNCDHFTTLFNMAHFTTHDIIFSIFINLLLDIW